MGVTFANIICRIFALLIQHWLWIVAVNAFGMTLDISLWLKIVKMPYCVWPEEHKPTRPIVQILKHLLKMILKIMEMMKRSFVSFAAVTSRQNKVAASTKGIVTKHIDLK